MKHSRLISLLFLIIALKSNAQLTGWPYRSVIQINENSGDTLFNYQVRLTLNTADSIAAGRFTPACSDLVFAKYCNGGVVYPHWIESAVNTPATVIWVRIDTLLPNSARNIYLFYGNTTNPSFSNFFITFPSRKIVSSNETVTDTVWNYDWVEIYSGDTATLSPVNRPGKLTINARKILINGVLNATGAGYKGGITGNGDGPGGGKLSSTLFGGGGGAAYGGAGGVGCGGAASGGAGGFVYGSSSAQNIEPGSGGAPPGNLSAGGYGGDGGGSVTLNATSIEVNDLIRTDGTEGDGGGSYSAGGGGSGGGILINGRHVSISGNLSAKGGKGADPNVAAPNHYGGGGGAGGRIKIFYDKSYSHTGINLLNGGVAGMCNSNSGQSGAAGTFHTGTYASGYPTVSVPSAQVSFGNFSFSTAGLIASFTDQTSSSSSWSWDFGDGSTDNTKNPQHVYTQEGTYNVCLTVTAPCGTDQVCKQVIVTSPATAWKYKSAVNIQENSSKQLVNYQIRISLNTMDTIAAGRMKTDCSDLRFARNCDGSGLLDYWIESGANTTGTLIWIKLDTLKPGQTKTVYMLYGNPAAAAQSSFSSTFPNNRIITGPLAVPDTVWNYDWV
jgi:hypothetical protein